MLHVGNSPFKSVWNKYLKVQKERLFQSDEEKHHLSISQTRISLIPWDRSVLMLFCRSVVLDLAHTTATTFPFLLQVKKGENLQELFHF